MKKLLFIALLLIPFLGTSQIVYTNANDIVILSMNDIQSTYSATWDFDIDGDNQRDFVFKIKKGSISNLFQSLSIAKDATWDNQVFTEITGNPLGSNPNTDQMVDMEGQLVCPGLYIPSPYTSAWIGTQGWFEGTAIEWENDDLHNGDISLYLGLEFTRIHPISGDTNLHYGYAHIGLGANRALVLHSYAWNPNPGECIVADDYNLANSGIICTQNVTVYDTTNISVFDTTMVTINDTTFFNVPIWDTIIQTVFDTTFIQSNDTIYWNDTISYVDTTYFQSNDTIYWNDTTFVTHVDTMTFNDTITYVDTLTYIHIDTNWINLGTYLDTLTITVVDTIIFNDTVTTQVYDTLNLYVVDTIYQTVWDTVDCGGGSPIGTDDPIGNTSTLRSGNFGLYPNPAETVVNIQGFFDDVADYYLIDILGSRTEINDPTIYVDHFPPGIYMIEKIHSDGKREVEKFQKH